LLVVALNEFFFLPQIHISSKAATKTRLFNKENVENVSKSKVFREVLFCGTIPENMFSILKSNEKKVMSSIVAANCECPHNLHVHRILNCPTSHHVREDSYTLATFSLQFCLQQQSQLCFAMKVINTPRNPQTLSHRNFDELIPKFGLVCS
jgi:hypothetical protein